MKHLFLAVLAIFLFASRVFACWDINLGSGKGTGGYLVPTASFGWNLSGSQPSYGFGLDEGLIVGNATPTDSTHTSISPFFGVTAGLFVDMGPFIQTTGSQPVIAKGALGILGPDLGSGIIPGGKLTFDFQTGEQKFLLVGTIPFTPFEDATIKKLF